MDLYDEKEHVISSDEYSDDDDALMNDAVRPQVSHSDLSDRNIQPKWKIDQKQKELSSLIRRNKISVIYKNKSIKWLNNKKQREKYKEHIYVDVKKSGIAQILPDDVVADQDLKVNTNKKSIDEKSNTLHIKNVDDEADYLNISDNVLTEKENFLQTISKTGEEKLDSDINNLEKEKNKENIISEEKCIQQQKETNFNFQKIREISEKRPRSSSPLVINENHECEINKEKKIRTESPQFYKNINEMFPMFDKVATNYIDTITNSTLAATEDKMKSLLNEIQTLNDILHTKEIEWNRLLHLKMVKEEIYSRLNQKRHNLQLKDDYSKTQSQNTLTDLKDLEFYLAGKKTISSEKSLSSITIKKLIENRANMNAEDLQREKNNTSRLHSLLVSRNMLHETDSSQNAFVICNGEKTSKSGESYCHSDGGALLSNRGRQGEFRDVKSIIADFRQKNPELLPRVGKRIKSCESNAQHQSFSSIPLFEKSSRPQYLNFTKDHQSEFYPFQNSVEEISITPIGRSQKLSSNHDIDFVNTMNNHYNLRLEDSYLNSSGKKDFDDKCPKANQYPLCQECRTNESRFVCAGCGNQWYCSKSCQISAWDKHSELCTE